MGFYRQEKRVRALVLVQRDEEACFVQPSLLGAAGELARRLIAVAPPGLSDVTFTNSGTEAIEAAIKLCFQATGRRAILSTDGGFHGKTLGALSASGRVDYQTPFGLPLANFHRVPYGDLNALRVELEARRNHYAAFVVEPIQGEGGVIVPPPNYLREAKRLCTDQGVLLVVDEVQTGLGRTGYMFACEADQVTPDVLTLAKALGGGVVPIGAVLCSEQVFGEDFALKHSSTFAGNALASRAGLAPMDLLERADRALLRQIQSHGAYLRDRLTEIQRRHPDFIEAISGRGFMLGIRFSVDRAQWREGFLGIVAEQNQIAQLVASYLLNVEGLRVAPTLNQGQVLRIQPPLNATRKQRAQAADAIDRCMAVLATGDTGRFFGSIFDRRARPAAAPLAHPARPPAPYVDTDARFGFPIHPLDAASFAEFDASLAHLDTNELSRFVTRMDGVCEPFVSSSVRLRSRTGACARGEFILVGHTTESLLAMSREECVATLRQAVGYARDRGAQIVGLGAYTSVLSAGGLDLIGEDVPLTSGNSFTAVAGIDALEFALQRLCRPWHRATAAVIGAAGSIGRATTLLLSNKVSRLILIGNPARGEDLARRKLLETAAALCRQLAIDPGQGAIGQRIKSLGSLPDPALGIAAFVPVAEQLERAGLIAITTGRAWLVEADLVVTATSFPGAVFEPEDLNLGAVVCDLSRPRSVDRSIGDRRPDVLVIDGGLIEIPGRPRIGPYGLEKGLAYACMAETMVLALERRFKNCSLGADLSLEDITLMRRLASKHGFKVAGLQSFGKTIGGRDWQRLRATDAMSNAGVER